MRASLVALALVCVPASSIAEEARNANVAHAPTELQQVLMDATDVDPFTGGLLIQYDDIKMPGNGGMDIVIKRTYSSNRIVGNRSKSVSQSYEHSLGGAGAGWSIQAGPSLAVAVGKQEGSWMTSPLQRFCSGSDPSNFAMSVGLPDGREMLLYTYKPGVARSIEHWEATCANWVVTLKDPAGFTYTLQNAFNDANGNPKPLIPGGIEFISGENPTSYSFYNVMVATRKTDTNGNWLRFTYDQTNKLSLSRIDASDGRWVTLTHADVLGVGKPQITAITTSAGDTWRYEYERLSVGGGIYGVKKVTLPTQDSLNYEYYDGPFTWGSGEYAGISRLKSRTTMAGGKVTYTYKHHGYTYTVSPGEVTTTSSADSFRVANVSYSTGGSRSYTYSHGGIGVYDTTTLVDEAGTTVFKHIGSGYNWNGSSYAHTETAWRVGLLVEKHIGTVRSEYYSYQPIEIAPGSRHAGASIEPQSDSKVRKAIISQYRVISDGATYTTDRSNLDAFGNAQTVTETGPNGGQRTTQLTYLNDTALWIIGKLSNETTTGVGTIIRTWDARGNKLSESRDGVTTSYTYHPSGDIWTMKNARGFIATYTNYWRGIARSEAHPEGVNISRVVDEGGRVVSETNGDGKTTAYAYDGLGRQTRITPPVGNPTVITYTPTTKTETRGAQQKVTTVDGFGRPTRVSTNDVVMATSYDSLGRKTFSSIMGFPNVGHLYQYDILNRTTRITHNADNSYRTFTYSSAAGIPSLAVQDERGFVTTHRYRGYGDPDKLLLMAINAPVAEANVLIERNGRGLITSATQAGLVRKYNYDSRYYLTSTVLPEVGTTTFGRDAMGNMTSKQVGSSGVTTYEYDGRNRLWRVTYPEGYPSQVVNTYSGTDKLKTVVNAVATRRYGYDANQNLTSEILEIDGLSLAAAYNYNSNDHLSSIVYPVLNRTAEFGPDVFGRPSGVKLQGSSMLTAGFWPNGQIYELAFAGGSKATYGMNRREWLSSITVTAPNEAKISTTFTYDVAGNTIGINDAVDSSYNRDLVYDGLNRISRAAGPWGAGQISYDGSGNIKTKVFGQETSTLQYDPATNRLINYSLQSGSGGANQAYSLSYDTYGNVIYGGRVYTYDNASNLRATSEGWGFMYDGKGSRVKTIRDGVTTYEFRSAQGLLLAELQKRPGYYDELKEHMYVAGKEVAEQRTQFSGSTIQRLSWQFFQPDAAGTPISSTWAGGGLVFKENYHVFGKRIVGAANGYTNLAFGGHRQVESDLIHMGARYYNPALGRFLSIDPKDGDPSDLHSLNRYAFANNNPYRFVDPDGHTPLDIAFLIADGIKLGVALYTGVNVSGAAFDFGMSAVGVFSPVPGGGEMLKAVRAADKIVDGAKAADRSLAAAKEGAGAYGRYKPGAEFSTKTKNEIAEKAGHKCEYCGVDTVAAKKSEKGVTPPRNEAQTDHIVPKSEGGTNAPSNAAHACRGCNRDMSNNPKPSPRGE